MSRQTTNKSLFSPRFLPGMLLFLFLGFFTTANATHLRAGNITATRVNCSGRTIIITLTVYTDEQSPIKFSSGGFGILDFGDGSPVYNPPEDQGNPVPGFSPTSFHYVVKQIVHTYAGPGRYVISYFENNRNKDILNMFQSVLTPFYIDTTISLDVTGCDNSPILTVPPLDQACTGVAWSHNAGAYDIDGDSLSYALVVPKQDKLHEVVDYTDPNTRKFYLGSTYNTANEAKNGVPTFKIDSIKGTVTWDSPGLAGQYNIAFHIIEWRKFKGVWLQLGYVTRDMQIIVQDCDNHRPQLIVPADICVEAGTPINQDIFASDPDQDSVKIEAFSQVFSISPSPAVVTPSPAIYQRTAAGVNAKMHFTWQTECLHIKQQPYQVVFKVTDHPRRKMGVGGGVALVSFETWNIRVVGPAPKWTSVTAQPGNTSQLIWESYTCQNATIMQIWRRVESNPADPEDCVTGMPDNFGYTKIAEVPIKTTQYTDNNNGLGLAPGTQYCYRLVAAFPLPQGGLSIVSKEQCFISKSNAPIITNVSIGITDTEAKGLDTIRWVAPLATDIDPVAYPAPYSYSVLRAPGYASKTAVPVFPGKIGTTFFVDDQVDTKDKIYNYRVIAYGSNNAEIDTSAVASSVRLELKPLLNSMELTWTAVVPWSNLTPAHPKHYIYRGPENSTLLTQLTLIDSVNVLDKRFHYIDKGPLEKTQTYCYCVRTSGGYGNGAIPEPLLNYSQIICAQPNDSIPPCQVVVNAKGTNCADVLKGTCTPKSFSNTLTWARPSEDCAKETFRYTVYVASESGGTYMKYVQNVSDTFFIDTNLATFARCYKVAAVNRSGIEGPLSEPFCFDNCPYYEMPNVFTPGVIDNCNDVFSAYSDRVKIVESPDQPCQPRTDILSHCARFVNSVVFTVFNRWGKEVYTYQSGGENSIYVDWDGRDDEGNVLSSGVYYYVAKVNFNVVDPSKRDQTIKGWVQVVR